jgi:hypothetical protein
MQAESPKVCPKCKGEISFSYGLAAGTDADGNPRAYWMCLEDSCNWMGPKAENVVCFPFGSVDKEGA